ncbi:MAG: hypothetical protein R3F61_25030 [Myxococcota bacterium]
MLFLTLAALAAPPRDPCAEAVLERIRFAYNDGGLQLESTLGPIRWNEGVEVNGQPSLASRLAYAVHYTADPDVTNGPREGRVLVTVTCSHDEPSRPHDTNGDGVFTLADATTKGQP